MKRTISEADIKRMEKEGRVTITRDMILTPSAREYAVRKGYKLVYSEETRQAQQPMDREALGRLIEQVVVSELSGLLKEEESRSHQAPKPVEEQIAPSQAECLDAIHTRITGQLRSDHEPNRAVIAITGLNRPGIVTRFTKVVADLGADLADMNQVIVDKYFSIIFIVDLSSIDQGGTSFRVFKEKIQDMASQIGGVEAMVMHEKIFQAMHRV